MEESKVYKIDEKLINNYTKKRSSETINHDESSIESYKFISKASDTRNKTHTTFRI